jgi:hypothetical protein
VHDLKEELGVVLDEVELVLEVAEAVLDLELFAQPFPEVRILGVLPRDLFGGRIVA